MRWRRLRRLKRLLPGLLASLLAISLMQIHAWSPLERKIADQLMRWSGPVAWDEAIVAVKVDDRSLSRLEQAASVDDYYADLVAALQREGTSAIAFSMLFPDSFASQQTLEMYGGLGRLAEAMATHGRVAIGQEVSLEGEAIAPASVLAKSAIATGHLRVRPDSDGITRWAQLAIEGIPALGVAAIQAYSLENELVGIPLEKEQMRLHWPGPARRLPAVSSIDVLEGNFPAGAFRNKIAIVGFETKGRDMPVLRTPFDEQMPVLGDYIHAAVIHNLLQQSWLRSPSKSSIILLLMLCGSALSGFLYQRPAWIKTGMTLGLSVGWLLICFLLLQNNYLLPTVAPVVTVAVVGASMMLLGRLQSSAMLQARSAFLNTMSHEIRTPLNAIVNLSEMMQGTPLDDRQHEFVDSMHNSSQTLLALINDILDFSKIESEKLVLEEYPVDLCEIVERSLEMLAPRAAEKKTELTYAIAPQTPTVVLSDPVRLQQILLNLLSNAVKFTDAGQISVEVEAIPRVSKETWYSRLSEALQLDVLNFNYFRQRVVYQVQQIFRRQSKQQIRMGRVVVPPKRQLFRRASSFYEIRFAVRDTGIGIPSERVGELFKPFSQLSPAITRKYGGTGLGLAISQRLSERMGGRLWVKSQLGKGSTFFFSIRAHLAHPQPTLPNDLLRLEGLRLLLVDRNTVRTRRLVWSLADLGIYLEPTSSLADATAELKHQPPFNAIVLDDAMVADDSSCDRAIRTLRRAAGNVQLPVILLSTLRGNGFKVADTTVLWKPVKQDSLYQALQFIFLSSSPSERVSADVVPPDYVESLYQDEITISPLSATASRFLPSSEILSLPGVDPKHELMLPLGSSPKESLRILIAEDNRINQRVALRMLELLGYEADVVTSGRAVLETLKRKPYDVVLMDMRMPELDGLETTRRIRQNARYRDVWIVAMTANAMNQDRERCLKAGMNDYLSKPINREALSRALERCLAVKATG